MSETFDSIIDLPADTYTIMVHNRFFFPDPLQTPDQSCYPKCNIKYDTAVGVRREVALPDATTSTDAYIGTGIVGFVMLSSVATVVWAARSGKINMEIITKALTRETVLLPAETLLLIGDCITFTMTVMTEIIEDRNLKDIIPPAIFFLVTGWLSSTYVGWQNIHLLKQVRQRKSRNPAAMHRLCRKLEVKYQDLMDMTSAHSQADEAGDLQASSRTAKFKLVSQFDSTLIALARHNPILITLFFQEGPFVVISAYVLLKAQTVELIVVIAFGLATIQLGGKLAAIAGYTGHLQRRRELSEAIRRDMDDQKERKKPLQTSSQCIADPGDHGSTMRTMDVVEDPQDLKADVENPEHLESVTWLGNPRS